MSSDGMGAMGAGEPETGAADMLDDWMVGEGSSGFRSVVK